jgi:hypothetical protein
MAFSSIEKKIIWRGVGNIDSQNIEPVNWLEHHLSARPV